MKGAALVLVSALSCIAGVLWFGFVQRMPIPGRQFVSHLAPGEHVYSLRLPELKSCYVVLGYKESSQNLGKFDGVVRVICGNKAEMHFEGDEVKSECNWLQSEGLRASILGRIDGVNLKQCSDMRIYLQVRSIGSENTSLWICYTQPRSSL